MDFSSRRIDESTNLRSNFHMKKEGFTEMGITYLQQLCQMGYFIILHDIHLNKIFLKTPTGFWIFNIRMFFYFPFRC